MLPQQRQEMIRERTQELGVVKVADLVRELGVSEITVRRDLDVLAGRGVIAKVYGGATAVDRHAADEPGFFAKQVLQRPQKAAIAARAARLVTPGSAVALSAGTTTALLAHELLDVPGLTVLTNSIPVADIFYRSYRTDQTIILTGGTRTPSDALVGPVAVNAIASLHVDMLFLGVHGMSVRAGFTTPNLMEYETDRALVAAARRLTVVADSSKWEMVGICTIARLSQADTLVTDPGLDASARRKLGEACRELVIAG